MDPERVWDAFDGRPHRARMGVRPLDPTAWTEPPAPPAALSDELDRRAHLVAERPGDVVVGVPRPGLDEAALELLVALTHHLAAHHPRRYTRDGPALVVDGVRRIEPGPGGWAPALAACGQMAAVDWCLVAGDPPALAAGVLCSPNRWRPAERVGLPVTAVHGPVPGYATRLGPSVDRLLSGSGPGVWRRNWSILDSPDLYQPVRPPPAPVHVPDGLWVRSERQTLVTLPRTGWWVFGIDTAQRPLADLAGDPERAARVRLTVAGLDDQGAAYKDLAPFLVPLLRWLDEAGKSGR